MVDTSVRVKCEGAGASVRVWMQVDTEEPKRSVTRFHRPLLLVSSVAVSTSSSSSGN